MFTHFNLPESHFTAYNTMLQTLTKSRHYGLAQTMLIPWGKTGPMHPGRHSLFSIANGPWCAARCTTKLEDEEHLHSRSTVARIAMQDRSLMGALSCDFGFTVCRNTKPPAVFYSVDKEQQVEGKKSWERSWVNSRNIKLVQGIRGEQGNHSERYVKKLNTSATSQKQKQTNCRKVRILGCWG